MTRRDIHAEPSELLNRDYGRDQETVEADDTVGNNSYLSQYLSTSACAALAVQASKSDGEPSARGYISVGRRIDIEHDVPMLGTNVAVRQPSGR